MSEPNDRLERAYRSLAREEPPASLDASILAASRRAVARPSLARRWGVPVSVAALLVLAVGVTLEMQHERPGIELAAPNEPASGAMQGAPAPQASSQPQAQQPIDMQAKPRSEMQPKLKEEAPPKAELRSNTDSQKRARPALVAPRKPAEPKPAAPALREEVRKDQPQAGAPSAVEAPAARALPRPFAEAPAAPPQVSAALPQAGAAPQANTATQAERFQSAPAAAKMAKRSAAAGAAADVMAAPADPHTELERIAKLREAGRDEDADRALEEFRKRYPDYRIDDAMWQRVKPS